jgi:hypothetical protein
METLEDDLSELQDEQNGKLSALLKRKAATLVRQAWAVKHLPSPNCVADGQQFEPYQRSLLLIKLRGGRVSCLRVCMETKAVRRC